MRISGKESLMRKSITSFAALILNMSPFSPEIAAHALIPKEFLNQASSLHFALHLGQHYVEAALAEAAGGEFHWARAFKTENEAQHENDVIEFVTARNWNERVFRKCSISFDVMKFALVPSAFYSQESAVTFLEFNCGAVVNDVHSAEIREVNAFLIYESPQWINDLTRIFPNGRFFPSAYLFLKHACVVSAQKKETLIIAYTGSLMLLAIFRDGRPLLLNGYPVQNEEDVLYHASNAAMRLQVDFENVPLFIYSLSGDKALHNLMKHYNRNCTSMFEDEKSSGNEATFITHLHMLCA